MRSISSSSFTSVSKSVAAASYEASCNCYCRRRRSCHCLYCPSSGCQASSSSRFRTSSEFQRIIHCSLCFHYPSCSCSSSDAYYHSSTNQCLQSHLSTSSSATNRSTHCSRNIIQCRKKHTIPPEIFSVDYYPCFRVLREYRHRHPHLLRLPQCRKKSRKQPVFVRFVKAAVSYSSIP